MSFDTSRLVTLLSTTTTTVAAPATIDDEALGQPLPYSVDQAVILVKSTAGSNTMTVGVRIWGFCPEADRWYDLGPLNGGSSIAETSKSDVISYAEGIAGLRAFTRLYVEVPSIGGTNTAITVQALCIRAEAVTSS